MSALKVLHKKNKLDTLFVEANRLNRLNEKRVVIERQKRSRKDVRAAGNKVIGNDEACASSDHSKTKTKRNRKGKSQVH